MKNIKILLMLLLTFVFCGIASANTYVGSLGVSPTATDKFYLVCPTRFTRINYQLVSNSAGKKLTLCGFKSGGCVNSNIVSTSITGRFTLPKTIAAGSGTYYFELKKNPTVSGAAGYAIRVTCSSSIGEETGTELSAPTYTQNQ